MNALFAAVYDLAMAPVERRLLRARRAHILRGIEGDVLEIGAGTGANLPIYGPDARLVLAEPGPHMRRRLRARAPSAVDVIDAAAERLPFADASFDAVVSTLVLCSVERVEAALSEIHRVLRPGGTLCFIEHVRATGFVRGAAQDLMTPLWRCVAGNCHLNRRTVPALRSLQFEVEIDDETVMGALFPIVTGRAVKGR